MIENKIPLDTSTALDPISITTATPSVTTLNHKNEGDARNSLKKLAACHRQFYRRLSHVATTNTTNTSNPTTTTQTNVNDNNMIIMAARTSTCTDKKSSPPAAEETAQKDVTVQILKNTTSVAESNDSGTVIDDAEITSHNDNVMRVLNSCADVSSRLLMLTELSSPAVTMTAAGVSMETESYEGCWHLSTEGEATVRRRKRGSKPPMASANLIGKTTDVSSHTDDGSDFPTHTETRVTFGSGVDGICIVGSTDVSKDKRNKKNTTTISTNSNTISTTMNATTAQCETLLPPPLVNNQNKWTGSEEPNVSCHSNFKTFASSLSSESQSGLSFSAVHLSSLTPSVRRSLVEERKRDLFERSQEDTRARSRSRSPITEDLQRNSVNFPSVNRLVKMYTKILQDSKQPASARDTTTVVNDVVQDFEKKILLKENEQQLKSSVDPHRNSPLSDEGCTLGQSPYSSDCDDDQDDDRESIKPARKKKERVARSASSDSALGLDEEPMEPPANLNQGRRMTLTVTDLPLRPALLPLAEPTDLPDSPTTDVHISLNALLTQTAIPSKVLIEERVVEIPEDRFGSLSSSRRESAQSCISDYPISECSGVRFVRTPSVVVSDYSDDLMCGITLEEIEYFRAQRLRRRSSVETSGTEKDDAASDVSATSSCSNLYYCGSTISALDGAECYVNGIRQSIDRKVSNCSTCEGSGDEDGQSFVIPEQPEDLKEYISYCTDQMIAQQQHANRKPKKVGGTTLTTNTDTCNTNSNFSEP